MKIGIYRHNKAIVRSIGTQTGVFRKRSIGNSCLVTNYCDGCTFKIWSLHHFSCDPQCLFYGIQTWKKTYTKNESGNHPAIWIRSDVCLQLSTFKNIFATDSKAPPDPGEAIAMPEAIASPSHMHLEQRSSWSLHQKHNNGSHHCHSGSMFNIVFWPETSARPWSQRIGRNININLLGQPETFRFSGSHLTPSWNPCPIKFKRCALQILGDMSNVQSWERPWKWGGLQVQRTMESPNLGCSKKKQ